MLKFLQDTNAERKREIKLHQFAGLHPRVAEPAGLRGGFRVCILNEFPGAADVVSPALNATGLENGVCNQTS